MNKTKQQNNEASKTYVDLHIWRLDSKTQSEDCVFCAMQQTSKLLW